jgi:hypothetical protein
MKPGTPARASKRRSGAAPGALYRGVRVQRTGGRSRFSIAQIKKAIKAAIEKDANAFAGRD